MIQYLCSRCGAPQLVPEEVDLLDSGTVMICPDCDEKTVVELVSIPARRWQAMKKAAAVALMEGRKER